MAIRVRRGAEKDAGQAIATLRRSITELCGPDHRNDPSEIEAWLGNKTVASWRAWIAREDAIVLVAERDGEVAGVGMATLSGEIMLNYVHPEARFCGVSTSLLADIEETLRSRGLRQCRVESTITARPFYERRGFRPDPGNASLLSKPL